MSYTFLDDVKAVAPTLLNTDAIDDKVLSFMDDAEAMLNSRLAKNFITPTQAVKNKTGTVSGTLGDNSILGVSTSFTTELMPKDYIKIVLTGEVVKIKQIQSDTVLLVTSTFLSTFTSSDFFFIPRELGFVHKYWTAYLVILEHFSEDANNQDSSIKLAQKYWDKGEELLVEYLENRFYDNDYKGQIEQKTPARLVGAVDDSTQPVISDFLSIVTNSTDFV